MDRTPPSPWAVTIHVVESSSANSGWSATSVRSNAPTAMAAISASVVGTPVAGTGRGSSIGTAGTLSSAVPARMPRWSRSRPVGVSKSFRIPEHRVDSLKERALHPFTAGSITAEHRALRDISLTSMTASSSASSGATVRGRARSSRSSRGSTARTRAWCASPPAWRRSSSSGVGFNPDLTAARDGVLNGVLMGLTLPRGAAGGSTPCSSSPFEEFLDLKLKNYSSGMLARFAFAIMVQADADIMLIDEVLAVGDAAFGQKCMDVFHERRRAGKTIVLVTHDMATVQSLCHRAMLIDDGRARVHRRAGGRRAPLLPAELRGLPRRVPAPARRCLWCDLHGRVVEATLRDPRDRRADRERRAGEPIVLDAVIEAARDLDRPEFFVFYILNADGSRRGREPSPRRSTPPPERVARGRSSAPDPVASRTASCRGATLLDCWVRRGPRGRGHGGAGAAAAPVRGVRDRRPAGMVSVDADVEYAVTEPGRR